MDPARPIDGALHLEDRYHGEFEPLGGVHGHDLHGIIAGRKIGLTFPIEVIDVFAQSACQPAEAQGATSFFRAHAIEELPQIGQDLLTFGQHGV